MSKYLRFAIALSSGLAMVLALALTLVLIADGGRVLAQDHPDGSIIDAAQTTSGTWGPGTITATSDVAINAGVVIVIAPGTTIVVNGNYGFTVNGALQSEGPVIFTAPSATPGAWQGITYTTGSQGYLNQATVEYATHALVLNTANPITVSSSTLRYNLHATTAANTDAYGAGLVIMAGNHLISNTQIYNNVAWATGSSAEAYGGGVDIRTGTSSILYSHIYNNSVRSALSNGGGGGIVIRDGSSPLIQNSEVVTNTLVTQANLANGAGIGIYGATKAVIRNNWIAANQSTPTGGYSGGGGIGFETNARAALIDGNVIANNLSMGSGHSEGGGVDAWSGNVVTVTNNLFYGNRSKTIGGAMNINANTGTGLNVNVINNTVIGNSSADGGGLYLQSGGRAYNNIVVGNTATNSGGGLYGCSSTICGNNDVWYNTPNNYNGAAPTTDKQVDPLFLGLGDLVQRYHLTSLSPVINAGTNTGIGLPTRDYDGDARPQFTQWDMGFDEAIGPFGGVQIAKTINSIGILRPRQAVTYTLIFTNTDPLEPATHVLITDTVPAGLLNVDYTNTGAALTLLPGTPFSWQVEDLAPGEGGVITITAVVGMDLFAQTVQNIAQITSSAGDSIAGANADVCNTIQCLIDVAEPGETVVVPAGTYNESLVLSKPVSVTGVSSDTVIVRAPAGSRVMWITGTLVTNDVVISNMTFTDGNVTGNGGGIYISNGAQPRIENMIITNNRASVAGGGIYLSADDIRLIIRDSVIASNFAITSASGQGGGVYVAGLRNNVQISNTTLSDNQAQRQGGAIYVSGVDAKVEISANTIITGNRVTRNDGNTRGGGVYASGNGIELAIADSTISNNTADYYYGGGIAVDGITGTAKLSLTNSTVTNNEATRSNGGGIYANRTLVTMANSALSGNRAAPASTGDVYGGGLYLTGIGSNLTIADSTVSNNQSSAGGAGLYVNSSNSKVIVSGSTITNNEIVRNSANSRGGGIYLYGIGVELSIADSTLSSNTAENYGGAIAIDGYSSVTTTAKLTLNNVDISNNEATVYSGGGIYANLAAITITNSMLNNNRAPNLNTTSANGGGLYMAGTGMTLTVANSTFASNTANVQGGGLYVNGANAKVTIANGVITGNETISDTNSAQGGGLYLIGNGAMLTVTDSTLSHNIAERTGGAMYVTGNTTNRVTLFNTSITDNEATDLNGGGLYIYQATTFITSSTISGNTANATGADGGGIYFDGAAATISNTHILSNTADDDGGGIRTSASLTLLETRLASNSTNDDGGGIYAAGGTLTIYDSTLSNNATYVNADGDGGAIYVTVNAVISNTQILSNTANDDGGGVYNSAGTLTLNDSTLAYNATAAGADADGGALYVTGNTTLTRTSLLNNTASDDGGAIYRNGGNVTFNRSTLSNNTAGDDGGALYMAGGTLTIANSTLSGNQTLNAGGDGGALYVGNTANIYNATIFANIAAGTGGGIRVASGAVIFRNSIVTGNTSNNCNGTVSTTGAANLANDATCGSSFANNANSALLGPLADNGGATWTHMLLSGNPAVDSGNNAVCAAAPVNGIDQRGIIRPQSTNCDIGAVEAAASLEVAKSAVNDGGDPLYPGEIITFTIVLSNNSPLANTNVTISDTWPAHTSYIPGSLAIEPPSAGGSEGTQPILAQGITVDAGSVVTVTYAALVDSPLMAGTVITNTASVTSDQVSTPKIASVTSAVVVTPVINAVKSGPVNASVGETAVFTFTITNPGNTMLRNVQVVDDLAGPAATVSGDANSDGWLDVTETWVYTAGYTIQPTSADPLSNTVYVTATDALETAATATATHSLDIIFAPVLSTTKDGPAAASVGSAIAYTFTISHDAASDGSPVSSLAVTDDIAGAATYLSGDNGDNLLESGETWVYTASYTIQPDDPDPLVNTVTVTGQDRDNAAVTATATHSLDVTFASALNIAKTGPAVANVGQTVVYTFTVAHGADSDGSPVSSVLVTDSIAGAATYASGDDGDLLLELGEAWVYTASYTVQPGDPDPLVNTAVVAGQDRDGAVVTATAAHSTALGYAPLLTVIKDGPTAANVGETVTFTFTVSHDAASDGSPVSSLAVTDDIAGAATYLSGDDGDNLLESGETWVYTASYTIQPDDPDPLVNTATVTGQDRDNAAVTATATHSLDVTFASALSIAKTGPAVANVGQTVVYTFTVAHGADSDGSPISSILVTDSIAGAATYASGDDGDLLLELGEAWVYIASYTVQPGDPDPLVNTAVVAGQNTEGALVLASSNAHSLDVGFAPLLNMAKDGPAAANIGDTISYTFTVTHAPASDGSPVSGVSVSDNVAGIAAYVNGDDGNNLLDAGETWMFVASYLIPDGTPNPLINTGAVTGQDRDGETVTASDTHSTAISSALSHQYVTFLPLVFKNSTVAPDLVIENVTITQNSIQIVIKNQGGSPVSDPFWVDLYVNPQPIPTSVNQVWNDGRSAQGAVWGVKGTSALPLAPGQSLTLTYGDAYFWPSLSHIAWPLPLNTPVYVQVDSANTDTIYGAVLEDHEITGGAYNNISGPALAGVSATDQPADIVIPPSTSNDGLSPRE